MKVAGYTRVSTDEQAREGYSLAAQEESIKALCRAHGWELVRIYVDAGKSGKSLRGRDELQSLLRDAKNRDFERLIFWKLDRLARNLRDLLEISDRLEVAGVGVVSIQESIDTGTASGRMLRNILGSLAEFERETIVERIKFGLEQKAREGEIVGPLSLGYRRSDAGCIELAASAPLIAEAFQRYATGSYSLRDMAEWAATVGLRSTEDNLLDRLSIRKILTNVTYVGDVAFHKRRGSQQVVPGKHPAIINRDVFDEVQRQLVRRRRDPNQRRGRHTAYPLTGIGRCGHCDAPLIGTMSKSTRVWRYMRCSTAARHGKQACAQPMVEAGIFEGQIGAYIEGMRLPAEYITAVVEELRSRQQTPDLVEISKLNREIERWRRLFVIGEIDEDRYRGEILPLKRRLNAIEGQTIRLDIDDALSRLREVGNLWRGSDASLQRDFVSEVFERVTVKGLQVIEIAPKPTYLPLFIVDRRERFEGNYECVYWLPGQDSNLRHGG